MVEKDGSKWGHIEWTDAMDAVVLRGLETRIAYNKIAGQLGVSWAAIARRVQLLKADGRFTTQPLKRRIAAGIVDPEYVANIYALPPGHPIAWEAITRGTLLENTPYPEYKGENGHG